jgi:hypothetical protein
LKNGQPNNSQELFVTFSVQIRQKSTWGHFKDNVIHFEVRLNFAWFGSSRKLQKNERWKTSEAKGWLCEHEDDDDDDNDVGDGDDDDIRQKNEEKEIWKMLSKDEEAIVAQEDEEEREREREGDEKERKQSIEAEEKRTTTECWRCKADLSLEERTRYLNETAWSGIVDALQLQTTCKRNFVRKSRKSSVGAAKVNVKSAHDQTKNKNKSYLSPRLPKIIEIIRFELL